MKPYVIASPDYDFTSGGIKVMWALYGWLLAKGVEVYMNRRPSKDVIAIYPEIINGNPVGTANIVRYVLNTPGVMGGIDERGVFHPGPLSFPNEKVYYFSRMFGKAENENHYMFLPAINLNTFRITNVMKRTKTCYLIGKGTNKNIHPKNSIELNRVVASNQQHLADILNECHTLYIYDDLSAMMECARLCGCAVKYYGSLPEEQLELYEPGLNGISLYGKPSSFDAGAFRQHYTGLVKDFERKLDLFLEETQ